MTPELGVVDLLLSFPQTGLELTLFTRMAVEGGDLPFLRESPTTSPLQNWAWCLAIVLALSGCAIAVWIRRMGGRSSLTRKNDRMAVKRVSRLALAGRGSLEVIEFGGERILLGVNDRQIVTIARQPLGPNEQSCVRGNDG